MSAPKAEQNATQTVIELFAGSVSGMVQVLSGQPFDTVKVRLQTQSASNPVYGGVMDCVKKTFAQEGFAGFYKGTLTPLFGIGACVSIQFGALEYGKRYLAEYNARRGDANPGHLSLVQLFGAGAFSGLANSFLSGPIEHVRTRLQVQSGSAGSSEYKGPVDFAKKVVDRYGVTGLYKGQGITTLRELVGFGTYFSTYEWLVQRQMHKEGKKRSEIEAYKQCLFGAISGYTLWLIIYPIDVVKSKLQTDAFAVAERQYRSSLHCVQKTVAEHGIAGMYRGFGACIMRAGPVNAATFVAYEIVMNMIGR